MFRRIACVFLLLFLILYAVNLIIEISFFESINKINPFAVIIVWSIITVLIGVVGNNDINTEN